MPTDNRSPGTRMLLVDGLRGLAALWVVLFHMSMDGHLDEVIRVIPGLGAVCRVGTLGVYIFFVLSGFVIAHSVAKHEVDGAFVARFALRRSLRLDPPYWTSIAIVVGIDYIRGHFGHHPFKPPSVARVGAHLIYSQQILGFEPISVVYWTLCLEIQFYLLFCLLLWVAHRLRTPPIRVFALPLTVAAMWPLLGLSSPWPGSFLPFWYGFLSGMLANWAMRGAIRRWVALSYASILMLAAIRMWLFNKEIISGLEVATAGGVSLLLLWTGHSGAIKRWLHWRFLQVLGTISYSLYLTHLQVLWGGYAVLRAVFGEGAMHDWRCAGIAVLATVAGGWLFWWLVERPSLALAQRFSPSRKVRGATQPA